VIQWLAATVAHLWPCGTRRLTGRRQRQVSLQEVVWIADEALANGFRLLGASGSGKTILAAYFAFALFMNKQRGGHIFDPTGSFFASFITYVQQYCELNRLAEAEQAQLYDRIIVHELDAESGYVIPAPMFRRFGKERPAAVAERFLAWIAASMPESRGASVEGYNAIAKVAQPAALLMAILNLQVTDIPDLLLHFKQPYWQARFDQALILAPAEAVEAVRFFREEFKAWDSQTRRRQLNLFEVFLQPFRYHPAWRATYGSARPGFDYGHSLHKVVFHIGSGAEGEHTQRMLDWELRSLIAFIRRRGSGRHTPVGIFIDEISTMFVESDKGMEIFAHLLAELVHVLRRQYRVHPLCVIHQNQAQLHPQIAQHLAALGQIVGKVADYETAIQLVPQLFDQRPLVKYWDPVLMHLPNRGIEIVHHRPVEYTQREIEHMQAQLLLSLDTFKFLCRLSPFAEGGRRTELQQLDFSPLLGRFPDDAFVKAMRRQLAAASGLPIAQVLAEIEARQHWAPNGDMKAGVADATLAGDAEGTQDDDLSSLRETVRVP
jgi:hypothetical protein